MKTVMTLAVYLITFNSYASSTINCTNPSEPSLFYVLRPTGYDHYDLKVIKRVLNPQSCRSRWGCDYSEESIYTDKLVMTDYQGAMVFGSKRTKINMEDFEEVQFTYTAKGRTGKFEQKSARLQCHD